MRTLGFGGKLDLIRKAAGLTIGETSRKSEVPEKTLERILAGKNAPSAAHFVRLVKAFNISMDAIEAYDLEDAS